MSVGVGSSLVPMASESDHNPITGIKVAGSAGSAYAPLKFTVCGSSANLDKSSIFSTNVYICISRSPSEGDPVTDLILLSKDDELPFDYDSIPIDTNKGTGFIAFSRDPSRQAIAELQLVASKEGEHPFVGFVPVNSHELTIGKDLSLFFRKGFDLIRPVYLTVLGASHPLDLIYTPSLLDRFPQKDNSEYPLPPSLAAVSLH